MKHIIPIIICFTLFYSCNNTSQTSIANENNSFDSTFYTPDSTLHTIDSILPKVEDLNCRKVIVGDSINILVSGYFRGDKPSHFKYLNDEGWLTFYTNTKNFYIDKIHPLFKTGYDDCAGDSLTLVLDNRHSNVLIFIKGLQFPDQSYPLQVTGIPFNGRSVGFERPKSFVFNGIKYLVEVAGEDKNNTVRILNFTLSVSKTVNGKKTKQVLVKEELLVDTFPNIIFAGDLDNDSKPDFLIDISRHYEEIRYALFLSSKANDNQIVSCVGISEYLFDC